MKKLIAGVIYIILSFGLPYFTLMPFIKAEDSLQFALCFVIATLSQLLYPILKIWLSFYATKPKTKGYYLRKDKRTRSIKTILTHFSPFLGLVLLASCLFAYVYAYSYNLIIFGIGMVIFYFNTDYFDRLFAKFWDSIFVKSMTWADVC